MLQRIPHGIESAISAEIMFRREVWINLEMDRVLHVEREESRKRKGACVMSRSGEPDFRFQWTALAHRNLTFESTSKDR